MEFNMEQLADMVAAKLKEQAPEPKVEPVPNPEPSAHERMKEQERLQAEAKANEERIRADLQYDMTFDTLIEKHQGAFGKTAQEFRSMAPADMDSAHRVRLLKTLTAQQFFEKPENRALLTDSDKSYVEAHVLNKHESNVDIHRATTLLDQALNVQARLDYQTALRKGSVQGASNTPNIDAFIQRCRERFD